MPVRLTFHRLLLFPLLAFTLQACHDGDSHNDNSDSEVEAQELCFLDDDAVPVQITENNIEYVRTPDACFESLKGYRYSPNYVEIDGLRMHYIDEGPVDGDVVLMLHGQPTWSYLYRKMIPVLVDAGYRVIASDHIGMGRSDKPVDLSIHQYELHVAWTKQFINALELRGITLFVQDWGSLIGLRQLDALAGIKLIEGWSYSSRRLEQDLTVNSEGEATVLALPGLSFQRYDAVQ